MSEAGEPSAILMALYRGDRDHARELAAGQRLTLPELSAFGDLSAVERRVRESPSEVQEFSPDGWSALQLASFFGYPSVVVVLLRAGADHAVRSRGAQGNTALHAAIAGRCALAAIASLLAVGADAAAVDAQGYTPLHLIATRGDLAVAELLVACGADASVLTRDGKTVIQLADERSHPDLAEWFAESLGAQ
jgi:ankyrin repeat protein